MPPRHDPHDLSTAAQQYLLALRVMAGSADSGRVTAAQIARHLGVTTQAASEMFRRLLADGLVAHAEGRELHLTPAGRTTADGIFRRHALLEWLLITVIGLGWAESWRDRRRQPDHPKSAVASHRCRPHRGAVYRMRRSDERGARHNV